MGHPALSSGTRIVRLFGCGLPEGDGGSGGVGEDGHPAVAGDFLGAAEDGCAEGGGFVGGGVDVVDAYVGEPEVGAPGMVNMPPPGPSSGLNML